MLSLSLKAMWQSWLKNSLEVWRAATKYKHTQTAFVETFNKDLAKQLMLMNAKELQDTEKV